MPVRHRMCVALVTLAIVGCNASSVTNSASNGDPGTSGTSGTGTQATGPGLSWRSFARPVGTSTWRGIAYGNGTFIAVGDFTKAYSPDGATWTSYTYSGLNIYMGDNLVFANGIFMSVTGTYSQTTAGGTTWSVTSIPAAQALSGLTYGNGKWVAVDDRFLTEDRIAVFQSTSNGASWSQVTTNIPYYQTTGIAYGNGTYVIVGYGGFVATSPDANAWTQRSFGSSSDQGILNVAFGNGVFLASTNAGGIYRSTDGIAWTHIAVSPNAISAIAYGNGIFTTAGQTSAMYSSPDGITWTRHVVPGASTNFAAVTFGNGVFVAAGDPNFAISP